MEAFDPLALLLLGKNMLGDLAVSQEQHMLLEDLLDAAAFGDVGGIQRAGWRLEEQLFLFEEVSDQETAARRFFVALVQVLAAQQQAAGIIKAFPSTWRDGVMVSSDEVRLLAQESLDPNILLIAREMEELTVYGWITTQGTAATIESLDGDERAWENQATGSGRLSALNAGLLWNKDQEALAALVKQWGRGYTDPRKQLEQARVFIEMGKLKTPDSNTQDLLLSTWLDLYAPGLNGTKAERARAGKQLMEDPPRWTEMEGAATSSMKLYEKIYDRSWPGVRPGISARNILQAATLGLREIRDHGIDGCAWSVQEMGNKLVEATNVSADEEVAIQSLIGAIRMAYEAKCQTLPDGLDLLRGFAPENQTKRKRWALGWVGAAEALARPGATSKSNSKRKL